MAKKTITFHILQTQVKKKKKKNVMLQPPSWPDICVFLTASFWKKNIDVEQETKLKSGKQIRKRDLKERRQETH